MRCLRQLQEALAKNAEELRSAIVAEIGTPVTLTRGPQLDAPVEGIGWVADLAEGYEWTSDLGEAAPFGIRTHRWVQREPAGVVGAITPWNFPMQINLAKIAPALAAGCTVVLKPAPDSPWTATLLGRIAAQETDLPPGVLNIVRLVPARGGSAARRGLAGGHGLVHRINRDRPQGGDGGRGQPQEGVP